MLIVATPRMREGDSLLEDTDLGWATCLEMWFRAQFEVQRPTTSGVCPKIRKLVFERRRKQFNGWHVRPFTHARSLA